VFGADGNLLRDQERKRRRASRACARVGNQTILTPPTAWPVLKRSSLAAFERSVTAWRGLVRRDRASSLAAVVMLALAIGLNGVVFTIVDAMLVRGFPLVKDNARLVAQRAVRVNPVVALRQD
jgi:hypothetical protein